MECLQYFKLLTAAGVDYSDEVLNLVINGMPSIP